MALRADITLTRNEPNEAGSFDTIAEVPALIVRAMLPTEIVVVTDGAGH